MKVLLKLPTRSRPGRAVATLQKYMAMAGNPENIGVLISCDTDDTTMNNPGIRDTLAGVCKKVGWFQIRYSNNHSKIEACNANMNEIDYPWDIVVLVSDDMIPQQHGYDTTIRLFMRTKFPDTDGILWFNDGSTGGNLNTLSIMGRKMYESFGYIYNPVYKSFYCDNEFTDLCRITLKDKCMYSSACIIRHEHPSNGFGSYDALYMRNQLVWNQDMYTYVSRTQYAYDWSVLIPTIPGREQSLANLQESIREKVSRIYPELRYQVVIEFDNRVLSIGAKREKLLQKAHGKYMSFIDDDDDITDAYIEDLRECISGNYHVMQLNGKIGDTIFTHTTRVSPGDKMATSTMFQRPPNHLNPMITEATRWIHFRDATRGEDLDWCIRMSKGGFLTREYRTDPSRTHYIYKLGDRVISPNTLRHQQTITCEDMLKEVLVLKNQAQGMLRLGPHGFVSK